MKYVEKIQEIKESGQGIDYLELLSLADDIESTVGSDRMWHIAKEYFYRDELLNILEYICNEENI